MGKSRSLPTAGPRSMAAQVFQMSSKHPQLKLTLRRNTAIWQGNWCPSDLSDTYFDRLLPGCHGNRFLYAQIRDVRYDTLKDKRIPAAWIQNVYLIDGDHLD